MELFLFDPGKGGWLRVVSVEGGLEHLKLKHLNCKKCEFVTNSGCSRFIFF